MLTIIDEILQDAKGVTGAEMDRITQSLEPAEDADTQLGEVHNMVARNVYVLARRYRKYESLAAHRLRFETTTDEEEEAVRQEIARFHCLHKLATEMFWAQVRDDAGGSAWTSGRVGMRSGWMLVSRTQGGSRGLPPFLSSLAQMLGSGGAKLLGPFPPFPLIPPGGEGEPDEEEDDD